MTLTKSDYLKKPIEHIDIKKHDLSKYVDALEGLAFQARNLNRGAKIFDQMVSDPAHMAKRADRGRCVGEQSLFECGIDPGLRDYLSPVVGTNLGLIRFDDEIKGGGIDIALFGQHGFQRAHTNLHLGELRAVVMVVIVFCHDGNLAEGAAVAYRLSNLVERI